MYRVARAVLAAVYRILIPVKVTGAEHLPRHGPVILAANHISFFDTVVLMFSVPRRTYFVGKAEYMNSWTTRRLFPAFGLIPIERAAARSAMATLQVAAGVLEQGHVLGIYPEGTRSRDGLLHRGHSGVAQLALMTGAPVVPVGLIGTDRIQPIGARVPRPFRRAEIKFGPAIDPASYGGAPRRRRQLLTSDLMEAIRQQCGRPTSDDFASDEPPLIRGGNESVYQVHCVTGPRRHVASGRQVRGRRVVRPPRRRPCRRGPPVAVSHRARWRGATHHRVGDLCEVPTRARSTQHE